ncbi:MAG: hypothetical protein GJ680_19320 [Alteromonadaceae bacterium]|nr:hypothetical protein [Alteromonadaceae bacterium]
MFGMYARVVLSKLWKPALLALLVNWFFFNVFSGKEMPVGDQFYMPVLGLFALQNFLYALWLTWSNSSQNLWQQIFSDKKQQMMAHFGLFLIVSIVVQFLPLLVFNYAKRLEDYGMTTLDVLGVLYLFSIAVLAFGLGLALAIWRHWSMALLVFAFPLLWDLFFAHYLVQIAFVLISAGLLSTFILSDKITRKLVMSVGLSFGTSMLIGLLIMIPYQANQTSPRKAFQEQMSNHIPVPEEEQHGKEYLNGWGFKRQHSLLMPSNLYKPDWLEYQLPFFDKDEKLNRFDLEAFNNNLKTLWQTKHKNEFPTYRFLTNGNMLLNFEYALYQVTPNGQIQLVWEDEKGRPKMESGISASLLSSPQFEHVVIFTTHKMYWFDAKDNFSLLHTESLDSPMIIGQIAGFTDDQANAKLRVITANKANMLQVNEYDFATNVVTKLVQEPTSNDINSMYNFLDLGKFSLLHHFASLAVWRFDAAFVDAFVEIDSWFYLINFAALAICLIYFRKFPANIRLPMAILCLLFSLPILVVFLLVFERQYKGLGSAQELPKFI